MDEPYRQENFEKEIFKNLRFNSNQILFNQIKILVNEIVNKKVMRNCKNELLNIVNMLGWEGERFLLISLLESLDFKDVTQKEKSYQSIKGQFFLTQLTHYSQNQQFLSYFCQVIEEVSDKDKVKDYLKELVQIFKIPIMIQFPMAVSLSQSQNQEIANCGQELLKEKLQEYFQNGKPQTFSELLLSKILYICQKSSFFKELSEELKFLLETTNSMQKSVDLKCLPQILGIKTIQNYQEFSMNKSELAHLKKIYYYISPADLMEELLQNSTTSSQQFTQIMSEFQPLSEDDIFECTMVMANNHQILEDPKQRCVNQVYWAVKNNDWSKFTPEEQNDKKIQSWNIDNFIKACGELHNNLKWANVLKKIDNPNLQFKDKKCFIFLMKFYQRAKKLYNFSFPEQILFNKWKNPHSQLHFLQNLLSCGQPELVSFQEIQKKTINLDFNPLFKFSTLNPSALQFWATQEILEILIDLAVGELFVPIKQLFDFPLQKSPDILTIGLAQINLKSSNSNPLINEIYQQLFPIYLMNHANSINILECLWKINPQLMINAISDVFTKDSSSLNLSRVLDITQEIKDSLLPIVNSKDNEFSVALGILAGKRDFLHFDQWINERIKLKGDPFTHQLLKYIEENVIKPNQQENQQDVVLEKAQLTIESLGIIFENLMVNHQEKLSSRNQTQLSAIYKKACKLYPMLEGSSENIGVLEVEQQANNNFQKIYRDGMEINEAVEMLTKFKNSTNPTEKEIFACMISNLFDEYRFHNQYPIKELQITGQLFGALINSKLIDGVTLMISLRCVTDALEKYTGKRFEFGIKALEQFIKRVYEWPSICQSLFQIEVLQEKYPEMLDEIRQQFEKNNLVLEVNQDILNKIQTKIQNKKTSVKEQIQTEVKPKKNNFIDYNNDIDEIQQPQIKKEERVTKTEEKKKPETIIPILKENPKEIKQQQPVIQQAEQKIQQPNFQQPQIQQLNSLLQNFTNQQQSTYYYFNLRQQQNIIQQSQTQQQFSYQQNFQMFNKKEQPLVLKKQENNFNHQIYDEIDQIDDNLDKLISEEIRNNTTFHLNQIASNNIEEKSAVFIPYTGNQGFLRWFSRVLVQKRAALEQNPMQQNYVNLLKSMNKSNLYKLVIKETYIYLRILLNNKQERQNEKNLMKNIGTFLGQITLARNKAVVIKDLNIKNLLQDAYKQQKLEKVLPFVCRIIEGAKSSQVFHVNSPWLQGILRILTELSQYELKLNLKCEIQILFRTLEITLEHFSPSQFISNTQLDKVISKNQVQNENKEINTKMDKFISQQVADGIYIDIKYLKQFLLEDIDLNKLVAQALEKAIKEIINPVISRSVTIAMITTREIGLKDFATEQDESKIKRGINLILQNLAGSLALVTCRDPLKQSLQNHLKESLDQFQLSDKSKDTILQSTSLDNLDFGCQLIKRAVIEKALEDVYQDVAIQETIQKKTKAKEKGEIYIDENYIKMFESLPNQLRTNYGSLTQDQLRVYEDFGPSRQDQKNDFQKEFEAYKFAVIEKFTLILKQVELQLEAIENMDQKQRDQEFQTLISKGQDFIKALKNLDELQNDLNVIIFQILFSKPNSSKKSTYFIELLSVINNNVQKNSSIGLKSFFEKLPPDHILENPEIFQAQIFLKLIKKNMQWINELDQIFEQFIKKGIQNVQICLIRIIKELVFKEKLMTLSIFQLSLDSLKKQKNLSKEAIQFFEEIKAYANMHNNKIDPVEQQNEEIDFNFFQFVKQKFDEWLQISTETQIQAYIKNFEKIILAKGTESLQKFFVIATEIAINSAIQSMSQNQFKKFENYDYSQIDNLTKLITILLKTIVNFDKNDFLERIFDSVVLVLHKQQEFLKTSFSQRPYFRLFYNIIYDIKRPEYSFQNSEICGVILVFLKLFHNLQPTKYPSFAFSWLELLSNRYFMPNILQNNQMWLNFHQLLLYLFKFFKQNQDIMTQPSFQYFYKGAFRLMLVLLHDFPDFLSEYAYSFCEEIPESFIQIRNIVLAAYPKSLRLQDPFSVTHIDMIEDFKILPQMNSMFFERKIISLNLQNDIFSYLYNKNENDYRNICSKFISTNEDGIQQIDISVVNAFVIAVPWMINVNFTNSVIDGQKFYEIRKDSYQLFAKLLKHSVLELRDIILNSIINNIRYPNLITYYFINFVLLIFIEMDNENIQEHVTRIFVERLLVEKPHPWGITYTFIELIRDTKFNFKNKGFFKNSGLYEEILKLIFKSIVNSQNNEKQNKNDM